MIHNVSKALYSQHNVCLSNWNNCYGHYVLLFALPVTTEHQQQQQTSVFINVNIEQSSIILLNIYKHLK